METILLRWLAAVGTCNGGVVRGATDGDEGRATLTLLLMVEAVDTVSHGEFGIGGGGDVAVVDPVTRRT